jgi:hypothetical protein
MPKYHLFGLIQDNISCDVEAVDYKQLEQIKGSITIDVIIRDEKGKTLSIEHPSCKFYDRQTITGSTQPPEEVPTNEQG